MQRTRLHRIDREPQKLMRVFLTSEAEVFGDFCKPLDSVDQPRPPSEGENEKEKREEGDARLRFFVTGVGAYDFF